MVILIIIEEFRSEDLLACIVLQNHNFVLQINSKNYNILWKSTNCHEITRIYVPREFPKYSTDHIRTTIRSFQLLIVIQQIQVEKHPVQYLLSPSSYICHSLGNTRFYSGLCIRSKYQGPPAACRYQAVTDLSVTKIEHHRHTSFQEFWFKEYRILYHIQDIFLFYPELPTHSRIYVPIPSTFGLPYESVQTRGSDGTLIHMYFIYQPRERQKECPTIVFFHGNAGNMGHRLQNCAGLFHNLHCNILLVEYRGYGLSEGSPTEEGLYIDACASLDYLFSRNDVNLSEIIIFGRSLGGAVAIDLAVKEEHANKIWCVIVENTFTSIPEMAKVILGWRFLNYLPLMCYRNKFQSLQKMKYLKRPILFISGLSDILVPPKMMTDLHNQCSSIKKQIVQIPSGTHNETWTLNGYYHLIAVFLQNCRIQTKEDKFTTTEKLVEDKYPFWSNVQNV